MILLLTGCSSYYRKEEDYNYLSNNSIRFIRDDTTCFLINRNDIYYLLYFDYFDSDIYSDYYIDLNDIDSGIVINDLVIKRNDKIEINIDILKNLIGIIMVIVIFYIYIILMMIFILL